MSSLSKHQQLFIAHYCECWNAAEAARRAGYSEKSARQIGTENLSKPAIAAAIAERIAAIMPAGEVISLLADHARGTSDDIISFRTEYRPTTIKVPLRELIEQVGATIKFEEAYADRAKLSETERADHVAQMAAMRRRIIRMELQLERDPDATEDAPGPPIEEQVPYIDLDKCRRRGKMHLVKSFNMKDGKVELYDAQAAGVHLGKHHSLFKDVLNVNVFNPDDYTDEELARIKAGEDPMKVRTDV